MPIQRGEGHDGKRRRGKGEHCGEGNYFNHLVHLLECLSWSNATASAGARLRKKGRSGKKNEHENGVDCKCRCDSPRKNKKKAPRRQGGDE